MKYRKLHKEELEEVEAEFVKFLAANSITGADWIVLKKSDPKKVEGLIEIFSDIFWEKALTNIKCVEQRTVKRLRMIKFDDDEANLIELRIPEEASLNLLDPEHVQKLSDGTLDIASFSPELFTGKRKFDHSRNEELFNFIEQGARPVKLDMYDYFQKMIK